MPYLVRFIQTTVHKLQEEFVAPSVLFEHYVLIT